MSKLKQSLNSASLQFMSSVFQDVERLIMFHFPEGHIYKSNEVVYFKNRTGWNNIFSITHTSMIQFLRTQCGEAFYGTFLDLGVPDCLKREGIVV